MSELSADKDKEIDALRGGLTTEARKWDVQKEQMKRAAENLESKVSLCKHLLYVFALVVHRFQHLSGHNCCRCVCRYAH